MSQSFNISSRGHVPSQDFIMMNNNNNYLPGVLRCSDNVQFPHPTLLTNTPSPVVPNPTVGQNCALDTSRISTNMADYNPAGTRLYMSETGAGPMGSPLVDTYNSSEEVEVEMKPPYLCEHQGPIQNSNMSPNSDWSNAYYTGSPSQTCVNNFTFTTPTQSYLYSPALTATSQNRFQNARLRPQTFAPGCNTQWQHAVRRRLPWLRQASVSCPQGLSVFTDVMEAVCEQYGFGRDCSDVQADLDQYWSKTPKVEFRSLSSSVCSISQPEHAITGTNTLYSSQMNHPVASCSEINRRAKRRHTVDTVEDGCPSNKIHLTEDKIASHMKDLRIHSFSPPPGGSIPTGGQFVDTGQRGNGLISDTGQGMIDMMSGTSQGGMDMMSGTSQGGIEPMSDTHYPGQTQQNGCHTEFLRHSQRQWHDFKLLEEKLQMIDEDSTSEIEDLDKSQPVLCIVDGIKVGPKIVLPQDILDKIRNPCQEVVLWHPTVIQPKKEDVTNEETGINPDCGDMMEDSTSVNVPSCEERGIDLDDSGMETDPDDEIL